MLKVTVNLSDDLAERLTARAKAMRSVPGTLIGHYVHEGLERATLATPDDIDRLRHRHQDAIELHRDREGTCIECGCPAPCSTMLVLTQDRDYEYEKRTRP